MSFRRPAPTPRRGSLRRGGATAAVFALGALAACGEGEAGTAGTGAASSNGGSSEGGSPGAGGSNAGAGPSDGGGGGIDIGLGGQGGAPAPFVCDPPAEPGSLYELSAESLDFSAPEPISMCSFRGDVLLIVNTAAN
ncbi:MAG: hypothetical protein IPM79_22350 [Polyangiaceae bacterium]|jgi:hypothetical protein|nr:hypothetical protein [Polyangiaceae bacterium]MBK8940278.1 hypothetical protein [Polyangiaceae bacterium]